MQPPPQFGEEIPTIWQDNSAGLFFGELLPSHQDYDPGPPNTLCLVAVLSETCGNPCKLKNFLHRAGGIRRKITMAERK